MTKKETNKKEIKKKETKKNTKKKNKKEENIQAKILIITIMILMSIVILYLLLTGTANKVNEKEKITNAKFTTIAKSLGYETKDITKEQGEEREAMLNKVTSATKDDLKVDFYNFKTTKIAKGAFFNGEKLFSDIKNISYENNVKRGKNYTIFSAEDDKRYGIVSRIDNTLVLIDTTKNYKKDVEKIIEELGY